MEKLYFEIPGIARKEDAIGYIREFHEYQSDINGAGGLDRFTDNYEGWLEKLEQDYIRIPNEEKVRFPFMNSSGLPQMKRKD